MYREKINQKLAHKNFNQQTLNMIEQFVTEFDDTFGEYLSPDEVIERIDNNLNYNKKKKKRSISSGTYNSKHGKISLKDEEDKDRLSSVMFHEFLHCITTKRDSNNNVLYTGFARKYTIAEIDEGMVVIGVGVNEGMTEMLTQMNDLNHGRILEENSYMTLTQQMKNISYITQLSNLINTFLKNPTELEDLLFKNHIDIKFINKMDKISKMEKDRIVKIKVFEQKLKRKILKEYTELGDIICEGINHKKVNNLNELKEKIEIVKNIKSKLFVDDYIAFSGIVNDLRELRRTGIDKEKLDMLLLKSEVVPNIKIAKKIDKYLKMEKNDLIQKFDYDQDLGKMEVNGDLNYIIKYLFPMMSKNDIEKYGDSIIKVMGKFKDVMHSKMIDWEELSFTIAIFEDTFIITIIGDDNIPIQVYISDKETCRTANEEEKKKAGKVIKKIESRKKYLQRTIRKTEEKSLPDYLKKIIYKQTLQELDGIEKGIRDRKAKMLQDKLNDSANENTGEREDI